LYYQKSSYLENCLDVIVGVDKAVENFEELHNSEEYHRFVAVVYELKREFDVYSNKNAKNIVASTGTSYYEKECKETCNLIYKVEYRKLLN
jgi:hypothetical protein